jgi:FtsP/CotA-like multicopper oxidase with cupredoxin domain
MPPSRREILAGASALALAPVLVTGRPALAQSVGPISLALPAIDARDTASFRLEAIAGETAFRSGSLSPTLGFNQPYLGPIIRVRRGATVQAEIVNQTNRTISVHWHGLLIGGAVDGGPHQPIAPRETWRPSLAIDQPPATLIYHTHVHEETADGVYAGLGGVLIVDDGRDAERGLPSSLGTDDLVLVVQDKRFAGADITAYEPTLVDALHGFLGDTIVVNGAVGAPAVVPGGIVRLRLINLCNARNFDFAFSDGRTFSLVATDQGLLAAPVEIARLRLTPAERVELLVDFGSGAGTTLMSLPHDEGVGAMGMAHDMGDMPMQEDPFVDPFPVLGFEVDPNLPAPITTMPGRLMDDGEQALLEPAISREIVLNDMGDLASAAAAPDGMGAMPGMNMGAMPGMDMGAAADADQAIAAVRFGINGRPFDSGRIDHDAVVGSTERWILGGQMMGHPFHIHGARFRVVAESGRPPRPENSGWKDTVFVTGEIELLAYFPHAAPPDAPFMFHCHVLEHEDRGMMGQFTVTQAVREYAFELVDEPVRTGALVQFSVHLVDPTTGTRVTDAVIIVKDFNMEPEGMAGSNYVALLPVVEPGVQPMEVRPDMSGRWALVLEASVPGEAPVAGTIIVRVPD